VDVFVSYARSDAELARTLHADIERARRSVWIDHELEGAQAWWDQILDQIRACKLFVVAVSHGSIDSRACRAELAYAVAVDRPILPVLVRDVDIRLAPEPIPLLQAIDYRERTPDAVIELVAAVTGAPSAPPLPEPLPAPPVAPVVSIGPLRARLGAPSLTYAEQLDVLGELRERLGRADERELAVALMAELRRRPDVVESIGRDIDPRSRARLFVPRRAA
jgi:hypothetical protein